MLAATAAACDVELIVPASSSRRCEGPGRRGHVRVAHVGLDVLVITLFASATPTETAPLNSPNAAAIPAACPLEVIVEVSLACKVIAPTTATPAPVVFAI